MKQARDLATELGTRLDSLRFLLRDREDKYSPAFDAILRGRGDRHPQNRSPGTPDERIPRDLNARRPLRTRVLGGLINEYRYAALMQR